MRYFVFGYDARPDGGMHDCLGTSSDIELAKKMLEDEAPKHGYWHEYSGHIAIIARGLIKIIWHYAAEIEGNIDGGTIKRQAWSETGSETDRLLSEIP